MLNGVGNNLADPRFLPPHKEGRAVAEQDTVAIEAALRCLLSEIEAGGYTTQGHALMSDDAYLEARTVLGFFDTFRERDLARQTVRLVDVLGPLVAACQRHDYRDRVGARLSQTAAYGDAAAAVHSPA